MFFYKAYKIVIDLHVHVLGGIHFQIMHEANPLHWVLVVWKFAVGAEATRVAVLDSLGRTNISHTTVLSIRRSIIQSGRPSSSDEIWPEPPKQNVSSITA